ncbi:MAG: hypothetical protein KatS3mg115_1159 [Candidatus Poribacteria bacterium]|nr:MAG: hypothetical protein KatS3mg115_1159 [Candidatus Poribacteria bacterium]
MGLGAAAYLEALAFGVRAGVPIEPILQGVGGESGWRALFAAVARQVQEGRTVFVKFPELPYFLAEAQEQGFPLPLTEALYEFLKDAPREFEDNMNRPIPSFWAELMSRPRREER